MTMKTIRRYIYREVLSAVGFVTLGFLALFFFFDLVDELRWVNNSPGGYPLSQALLRVTLSLPGHLYELLPIAVLIGTIFVMARLAQSSEYTILRTSGFGPARALRLLACLGLGFVALTFAVGDYVAPYAEHAGQLLKARYGGRITVGRTGAWLREKQADGSYSVNVGALSGNGDIQAVHIYAFDPDGHLAAITQAQAGHIDDASWRLSQVQRMVFHTRNDDHARVERLQLDTWDWPTRISAEMVSAALLDPDRMRTIDLFQYIRHLDVNGQSAQRYEIEFWRKVFYPLSCLVMVVLALPFAYLHFRSTGIAGYVFGGVMAGISFFLLNNVFGFIGNLQNWSPWLAAAIPGILYSLLSLATFGWLVLRR